MVLRPAVLSGQPTDRPPAPSEGESAAIAQLARQFMEKYQAPGLSVAFARHGQLVYRQAFGLADKSAGERLIPSHRFRIASLSKPVTSAAIFSLIEQKRFALEDRVVGAHGLLEFDYGRELPAGVQAITVHHLLTHAGGGWQNDHNDPMFHHPAFSHKELITWTLQNQPLNHQPGSHYAYSNFGYCLLGRVVEKITRQSYADFVKDHILNKCGVNRMEIAGNMLGDRAAGEVVYFGQEGDNPYGMNVARMDSHGGWIATPADLVQFATHVDGFSAVRNILAPETIKSMVAPSAPNPHYACGWNVNLAGNWWHTGTLPGTVSILVRTASGLCWAGFVNTRAKGISPALDQLLWRMARAVPAWRS